MEFDELLITTGVDALVRLVKEKQKVELEDAASALKIAPGTVEEWARVLEEEGILRIEYRLTRVYLVWVKPTAEEVASEQVSFYEEKKGIESELTSTQVKISDQSEDFVKLKASFDEFYAKAYPKMQQLSKSVASIPAGKSITDDVISKQSLELDDISMRVSDVRSGLASIRSELTRLGIRGGISGNRGTGSDTDAGTGSSAGSGSGGPATKIGQVGSATGKDTGKDLSKELTQKISALAAELQDMQSELQDLKRKSAQQVPGDIPIPPASEIRKKLDALKKEFTDLRARNLKMREDMTSLQESSEILKSVAESIMGHEEKVQGLHDEMSGLSKEADLLMAKATKVAQAVKQHADLVERIGSSINVAKGVINRFPNQDKIFTELERTNAAESALTEKLQAMETLLEVAGGKSGTARQFTDLSRRIDDKLLQTRRELDALAVSLEDEKATYLTFQKIKERIVPSLESYQRQIDEMDAALAKARADIASRQKSLKDDVARFDAELKGGGMQEALKLAEDIQQRTRQLEDMKQLMDDLTTLSDNLSKRVTLLSREAKLLELRTGGSTGSGTVTEEKKNELRREMDLSQEEELEFRRKREELKSLIKKLWE